MPGEECMHLSARPPLAKLWIGHEVVAVIYQSVLACYHPKAVVAASTSSQILPKPVELRGVDVSLSMRPPRKEG